MAIPQNKRVQRLPQAHAELHTFIFFLPANTDNISAEHFLFLRAFQLVNLQETNSLVVFCPAGNIKIKQHKFFSFLFFIGKKFTIVIFLTVRDKFRQFYRE